MVNEYSFKIRKSLRALGGEGKRKKLGEFLAKNEERIEREIEKKKKRCETLVQNFEGFSFKIYI